MTVAFMQASEQIKDKAKIYTHIERFTGAYDLTLRLTGYEKFVRYFVARLPFPREAAIEVLDAGCGTGLYTLAILKRYPNARLTAFDLNAEFMKTVARKLKKRNLVRRAKLLVSDMKDFPKTASGKSFDLIITAGVLEHVALEPTVRDFSGLLADGGYFLNSPVRDTPLGRGITKLYDCKPYPRQRNIAAFTGIGFNLEKTVVLPEYLLASFKEMHLFKYAAVGRD